MANEIVKKFSESLTDKLVSVESALPKDFNRERFVQNCLTVMNESPQLAKINASQVIQGLCKAAYMGLDFLNKECYLIPYGNTVNFQTDYKGEVKFTKKYSIRKIQDIYAKVVKEGDMFEEIITDGHPSVNFKPLPFNDGNIIGAFAVVLYADGGMEYEVMSVKDINKIRDNFSKASNSKAWKVTPEEMYKKVVLRRLTKHISTDFESVEAHQAWEEGSGMEFTSNKPIGDKEEVVDVFDDAIEVETVEIPEEISNEADEVFK